MFVVRWRNVTTREERQMVYDDVLTPELVILFARGAAACDCVRRSLFKICGGEAKFGDFNEPPCGRDIAYVCTAIFDEKLNVRYHEDHPIEIFWIDRLGNPQAYFEETFRVAGDLN